MVTHEVCFSQVLEMNIIVEIKFATFSNSAFIIYYTFNIGSKLDRSVKGAASMIVRYNAALSWWLDQGGGAVVKFWWCSGLEVR